MVQLEAISTEILERIVHFLGCNLATHIALSQTCRRLRDLYHHPDSETFWQYACFRAGFGRPKRRQALEDLAEEFPWRKLARILVNHELHCEITTCRNANACFADKYRSSTRNSIGGPLPSPLDIALHPLYFYLHFTPSPTSSGGGTPEAEVEDPLLQPDYMSILLTHLPTFPESKRSQYGPLCSHPNASCAFATFPPMQSLSFQDPWGRVYITVENPDGITILDVNRAFAQLIPEDPLPVEAALAHYRDLLLTSGKSPTQFAESISRDRGFLDDHEYPFLQELVAQA